MTLDLTINLGNILTIVSFLVGGVAFVYTMRGHIDVMADRLSAQSDRLLGVEGEVKKMNEILIVQSVQTERMNGMDKRLQAAVDRADDLTRRFNDRLEREK